ncbi:MAG: OB-fold nucleic acid binding domain-containing protein [Nitrososphaerota archaeon]
MVEGGSMAFEDLVQQILSIRPDLRREEVLKMIEAKEKEAKGFLTRESAARALAIELGIKTSKASFKQEILIADLVSGLGDITVSGRVLHVCPAQKFARSDGTEGKVRHLLIADKSGEIKVVLWDDKADFPNISGSVDQIARFSHCYVRQGQDGKLELNVGSKGSIEFPLRDISEEDYPPLTNFTKRIGEITGKMESVNVLGIVERIYPATTFKRQDGSEGKVRRLEIRDSSGRASAVLWNGKVDELANISNGSYLEIFEARVKERSDGYLELHAGSSAATAVLTKKPSGWEDAPIRFVKIKNLKPKMNDVNLLARIMHKGKPREFRTTKGEVRYVSTLLIRDETGQVQLRLWSDEAHLLDSITVGDAVLIEKAYTEEKLGQISLKIDSNAHFILNPQIDGIEELPRHEDETVKISELKNPNELVTVEGTVATSPIIREVETSKKERVKVASFELADDTGRVEVALWRELAELAEDLSVNTRVRIRHIYVKRDSLGRSRLSSGALTSLTKLYV